MSGDLTDADTLVIGLVVGLVIALGTYYIVWVFATNNGRRTCRFMWPNQTQQRTNHDRRHRV